MKTITLQDISDKVNIAKSEVSRVLNQKPTWLSKEKQEMVLKAARELNYRPNLFARSLKTGKTNIIGITCGPAVQVRMMFTHAYFAGIFRGTGDVLTGHDYKMIFHAIPEADNGIAGLPQSRLVDGMICIVLSGDMETFIKDQLPQLTSIGTPFVVIHSLNEHFDFPNVGYDCTAGARLAAGHLIEHGYPEVGMVVVNKNNRWHSKMLEGYRQALTDAGRKAEDALVYESGSIELDDGYRLAARLLDQTTRLPRALCVTEDRVARGMIKKFTEAGLRVPEDIAVTGFGDYSLHHDEFYSDLTSLRQPAEEKGRAAAELLFKIMDAPETMKHPESIILEPELTIRKSCGCSPA